MTHLPRLRRLVCASPGDFLKLAEVLRAAGLEPREGPAVRRTLAVAFAGRVVVRHGVRVVLGITWR